jgi:hypothetical protein
MGLISKTYYPMPGKGDIYGDKKGYSHYMSKDDE